MSQDFRDLVAKDVRDECSTEELSTLAGNLREWLNILNTLKRDVEVQLVAQKARVTKRQAEMLEANASRAEWLNYKAEEDKWRVSAIRFMVSVEERMLAVKSLRANQGNLIAV